MKNFGKHIFKYARHWSFSQQQLNVQENCDLIRFYGKTSKTSKTEEEEETQNDKDSAYSCQSFVGRLKRGRNVSDVFPSFSFACNFPNPSQCLVGRQWWSTTLSHRFSIPHSFAWCALSSKWKRGQKQVAMVHEKCVVLRDGNLYENYWFSIFHRLRFFLASRKSVLEKVGLYRNYFAFLFFIISLRLPLSILQTMILIYSRQNREWFGFCDCKQKNSLKVRVAERLIDI